MKVSIVVGANYGDEGKGACTNWLAHFMKNAIVVRANGGAQAGHTVVTGEGVRHVFKHFGSGTLKGVPTYLSKHFILNPILFREEWEGLVKKKGVTPKVIVHPEAIITTPYDMIINQIVETYRGKNRHGSCGFGVFETITRSKAVKYTTLNAQCFVKFFDFDRDLIRNILRIYRGEYVKERLMDLGVNDIPMDYYSLIFDDNILEAFLDDLEFMREHVTTSTTYGALSKYDSVIFEGAQGLGLSMSNMDDYPNLTPSFTGAENILEVMSSISKLVEGVNVIYASRWYLTRHGSGPLENEMEGLPTPSVVDITNIPNDWQGTLRFGWLDFKKQKERIMNDYNKFLAEYPETKMSLFITCLDQVNVDYNAYFCGGASHSKSELIRHFVKIYKDEGVNLLAILASTSPSEYGIGPVYQNLVKGEKPFETYSYGCKCNS